MWTNCASKKQPGKSYTVNGIVKRLPTGKTSREIYIHHQDIPDFVSSDGKSVGMQSMTMGFAIPDGLDIIGIALESPVEFTFETDWDKRPALRITKIKKTANVKPADDHGDHGDHGDHSNHGHD